MKVKIKLKDMTKEQLEKYYNECSADSDCRKCPFVCAYCNPDSEYCWINYKDSYSEKFLDQEVEIEIPDLLTKEEKEYLENVFKPFKNRVTKIKLIQSHYYPNFLYIEYTIRSLVDTLNCESHNMSYFKKGTMYKNLKIGKEYTLEDLGLFQNDVENTITINFKKM